MGEISEPCGNVNWRPIYMGGELTNYSISNEGQLRVSNTLKLRSLSTTNGYVTCSLIHKDKKCTKQIHRLVAEAFLPNDAGKKLNNSIGNLEWMSASDNTRHM